MAKRKPKKKSKEDLHTENELLKLQMLAEFGGHFAGNENVPVEIENQFLHHIVHFHRKQAQAEQIPVYDYIGSPPYNHVHDMSDKELSRALKKMLRLMARKGIILDVLAPTPEKEVYRFITEELFKKTVDNIRIKGWHTHFIYEEFYPNAELDISNAIQNILFPLFDSEGVFWDNYFSENMKTDIGLSIDAEELLGRAEAMRARYHAVHLLHFEVEELSIDKKNNTAHAVCEVWFKTQKTKGKRSTTRSETVSLWLQQEETDGGFWQLTRISTDLF